MGKRKYYGLWGHCYSKAVLVLEENMGKNWNVQIWSLYENTAFLIRLHCSLPKANGLPDFNEAGASSFIDNMIFGGRLSIICLELMHRKGLIKDPENWSYGEKEKHTSYLNELVEKQISQKGNSLIKDRKQFLLFSFQPKVEKEENESFEFSTVKNYTLDDAGL